MPEVTDDEFEELADDDTLVKEIHESPPILKSKITSKNGFQEDRDLVGEIKKGELAIDGRDEPVFFRASSIGFCLRMQWYSWMGINSGMNDDTGFRTGAADHGNWIHDMIIRKITRAGKWRGDNVYIADRKLQFNGHIDVVIYHNELAVVEIKSMNRFKYLNYIRSPEHHHRLQLQSYLMMKKLDVGYLLPYNKDSDQWTLLKTYSNKDEQNEILNRLKLLRYYTSKNIRPERLGIRPKDNKECGWCKFRRICWSE